MTQITDSACRVQQLVMKGYIFAKKTASYENNDSIKHR